ncbi:OLC1v1007888C1 [Oldenlandia corymbosa var. corymbosa]|uniref:OLC1v1007888C1 n=1 Tax=Oldenlandia corymbosa var. corymbosa TaxID=529605 RepID=A0AAV1DKT9_OLDCO|nr:OLC1v1007888C1 [Oldenlandia corymbosa var. corymbosa]
MAPRGKGLILVTAIASELTADDVKSIRKKYGLKGLKAAAPDQGDRAHLPPPGKMTVYLKFLELGLKFPPPFVEALMQAYGMPLAQWAPNAIPFILGFLHIYHTVGVKADMLLFRCFFKMARSRQNYTRWFNFQHNTTTGSHIEKIKSFGRILPHIEVEKNMQIIYEHAAGIPEFSTDSWRLVLILCRLELVIMGQSLYSKPAALSAKNIGGATASKKRKSGGDGSRSGTVPSLSQEEGGKRNNSATTGSRPPVGTTRIPVRTAITAFGALVATSGVVVDTTASQVGGASAATVELDPPNVVCSQLGTIPRPVGPKDAILQCMSGLGQWAMCSADLADQVTKLKKELAEKDSIQNSMIMALVGAHDVLAEIHDHYDSGGDDSYWEIRKLCATQESPQVILHLACDPTPLFDTTAGIATPPLSLSRSSDEEGSSGGGDDGAGTSNPPLMVEKTTFPPLGGGETHPQGGGEEGSRPGEAFFEVVNNSGPSISGVAPDNVLTVTGATPAVGGVASAGNPVATRVAKGGLVGMKILDPNVKTGESLYYHCIVSCLLDAPCAGEQDREGKERQLRELVRSMYAIEFQALGSVLRRCQSDYWKNEYL